MFRDSLDAIRVLLKTTFPEVDRIYVNTVPAGFKRPSFFIQLATSDGEHLNLSMHQTRITWQIVYFAPMDAAGEHDALNQLDVSDKLQSVLMDSMAVTGPSGVVYHVLDCEGGPRDAEVYITVRLETEKSRPSEQYDLMANIQHDYNLKWEG